MEIKKWTYDEYPAFEEDVEGVARIPTTGYERGTHIYSNVEYANMNGVSLCGNLSNINLDHLYQR